MEINGKNPWSSGGSQDFSQEKSGNSEVGAAAVGSGFNQEVPPDTGPPSGPSIPDSSVCGGMGAFILRTKTQPHDEAIQHLLENLATILAQLQLQDTVIELVGPSPLATILDVDAHDWPIPPSPAEAAKYLQDLEPKPNFGWTTHSGGVKAVYLGAFHRARAIAACLSVPTSLKVEVAGRTRHPLAPRSDRPGDTCGPVQLWAPPTRYTFQLRQGEVAPDFRDEVLDSLNMAIGQRYGHEYCPIEPTAQTTATDCVVALEGGVHCHRCEGHGNKYRAHLKPGFTPYWALGGRTQPTNLTAMARGLVHWTHAKHVLAVEHSNLSEPIREELYRLTLESLHSPEDPRLRSVFNPNLNFVFTNLGWVDSTNFAPTTMDVGAASSMPACQFVPKPTKPGDLPKAIPVPALVSSVINGRKISGYAEVPLAPFTGIQFTSPEAAIPVQMPPYPKHAIALPSKPLPMDKCAERIEAPFPKISLSYLLLLLAGAIIAERGVGRPVIICVEGPTGSGKNETARLAASIIGDIGAGRLRFNLDEEKFDRQIGTYLNQGYRLLFLDELGRKKVWDFLSQLLEISSVISWRPLFKALVISPLRAAIVLTASSIPEALVNSPEWNRRCFAVRLHDQTPDWEGTCGGDTAAWRDACPENAHLANSILSHAYQLVVESNWSFTECASRLNFGRLNDASGFDYAWQRLYRYCRGEFGPVAMIADDCHFTNCVDLDAPAAKPFIGLFIAEGDDVKDTRNAWRGAQKDLQATAWTTVLGLPNISFAMTIHGRKRGGKFRGGRTGPFNSALPPIPADKLIVATAAQSAPSTSYATPPPSQDSPSTPEEACTGAATASEASVASSTTRKRSVTSVLKEGGLPI